MLSFAVFFVLCLKAQRSISQEDCRELWFTTFIEGKALKNHVIQTVKVMDEDFCGDKCVMEDTCVSYNFGSESGSNNCELNNATASEHPGDLEEVRGYIYRGSLNACNGNLCKHNATCQSGYTDKGYRCVCIAGYTAEHCDVDIDECASNPCQNGGNCSDLMNDYNCSCYPGYTGKMCEEVPEECRRYKNLTDKSRKHKGERGNNSNICEKDLSGWYRFTGEAGTRMYNNCPNSYDVCGTTFPGYLDDAEPEASEGQVERDVCFYDNGCKKYCSQIQVRRCVLFLVYNLSSDLSPKPPCHYRFCGSD